MTFRIKIIGITVIAAAAAALAASGLYKAMPVSMQRDETLAREVVAACAKSGDAGGQHDPCYEKTIPALMDDGISMERAFAITATVQELDPTYHYCHVLAHLITSKETAKDPSKWKDIIARSPSGVCGNGALHGAFQERFSSVSLPNAPVSEIAQMLDGACDPRAGWDPTFLERSSCMHGMGHLLLFVTDANVKKSLELCDAVAHPADNDFRETCREGIFMQIYQPLGPEEEDLVAKLVPAAKDNVTFCSAFPTAYGTCIKESWPLKRDEIMTAAGFESVCAPLVGKEGYDNCIRGLVYVVMGMKEYDASAMLALCAQLPAGSVRDMCVARTAERFVETDWKNIPQAIGVCAASVGSADACWEALTVFAQQGMRQDSPQTKALCGGMPEPWKTSCLTSTNTHI